MKWVAPMQVMTRVEQNVGVQRGKIRTCKTYTPVPFGTRRRFDENEEQLCIHGGGSSPELLLNPKISWLHEKDIE
ncbi:unnamed protein product [Fusarium graminearum]|uniref:Uncharacterized protein n=1 Tax=Gibberella zeae TaxID=5518 RepID=A0A4E9EGG5_GIBZA|nr:unnamed protein product [Fusarium graminearum]CAG1987221.1 unnamed protein product [Fusarium graminearum]